MMIFQKDEYLRRVRLAESALIRVGLDALIAYAVRNDPGSVVYLTGYEPSLGLHDVAFFVMVPGQSPTSTLFTNAFWDNPGSRTWVDEVVITNDFGTSLADFLPKSAKRIGIAGYSFFPTPVYTALLAARPKIQIEDATELLMEIAKVKSSVELEVIRHCVEMTDEGGRAFLNSVREGASEREIKAEVERAIMLAGSDGLWYNFQVYSGSQVAVGMGLMTGRTLVKGEQVQVDCGALYAGYRGDFSRVTTVGPPAREVRAVMETTADMYDAMLQTARAGVPVADLAQAALTVARSRDMERFLYRSPNPPADQIGFLGHGMSCWTHGLPTIHPASKDVLEPNMVLVFETILGQPGVGGAKIEDSILVTESGAERLSQLPVRTWPSL
jgi:Xaa-Pro dipeptidase